MKVKTIQRYTLYAFLFSINFEVWDPLNTGGFFSIARLAGLLYLSTIFLSFKSFFETKGLRFILFPIWSFFTLLTIVSIINVDYNFSNYFDSSLFQNIILFWILINHERIAPGILAKGLMAFALGSIVLASLYYFKIGIEYFGGRVSIFGDNTNTVGIRMSVSILIISLSIMRDSIGMGKFRYLLIIPLFPMVMLLAETGSRVAFIAFVIQFIAVVLLSKSRRLSLKILLIVVGSIIGYFTWLYLMEIDVLRTRLIQSLYNGDLSDRDFIWGKVIQVIKSSPIFGVGKTGYAMQMRDVAGSVFSPHNVFLEILVYTGIIGLYLYINFIYKNILIAFANYKLNKDLLPLLLFIPLAGLMLSGQLLVFKMGWVILAFSGSKIFSTQVLHKRRYENPLRNR